MAPPRPYHDPPLVIAVVEAIGTYLSLGMSKNFVLADIRR